MPLPNLPNTTGIQQIISDFLSTSAHGFIIGENQNTMFQLNTTTSRISDAARNTSNTARP